MPTSHYRAYVLCATPRSGSTLLCEMLAATGVAGRPNSFFREPDIAEWADRWNVPHDAGIADAAFDRLYLQAMHRYGDCGTGVFGLRLMAGSLDDAQARLDRACGGRAALPQRFEQLFGPVLYIHLSRRDAVAQAISLLKAERGGLWHRAADGSVLKGSDTPSAVDYDGERIAELVAERRRDEDVWQAFFRGHGIKPLRVVYEEVSAAPQAALEAILVALGLDPAIAARVAVPTAKLGGKTSRL